MRRGNEGGIEDAVFYVVEGGGKMCGKNSINVMNCLVGIFFSQTNFFFSQFSLSNNKSCWFIIHIEKRRQGKKSINLKRAQRLVYGDFFFLAECDAI